MGRIEPRGRRAFIPGRKRMGVLLDVAAGPVSFDSSSLHATEPWVGSRVVLVAYNMHKLGSESLRLLSSLGFRPPDPPCGELLAPKHCLSQMPKFPPDPPAIPTVAPQRIGSGSAPGSGQVERRQ